MVHSTGEPKRRFHRSPVIPPIVGPTPKPVSAQIIEALAAVPVSDLSDAVGRLYTMSARMQPIYSPMRRVIGTALTVKAAPGDNWAVHGALRLAGAGHVLVIDWRSTSESCGAGVSALVPAIRRGMAGVVVDGAWRDVPEMRALAFPMIATGITAFSPPKNALGEINVPVSCGDVVVCPGDLIVGDSDGTVVVPRRYIGAVIDGLQVHTPIQSSLDEDESQENVRGIADDYWDQFDRMGGERLT